MIGAARCAAGRAVRTLFAGARLAAVVLILSALVAVLT